MNYNTNKFPTKKEIERKNLNNLPFFSFISTIHFQLSQLKKLESFSQKLSIKVNYLFVFPKIKNKRKLFFFSS